MERRGVSHQSGETHANGEEVQMDGLQLRTEVPWHSPAFGTKEHSHMPLAQTTAASSQHRATAMLYVQSGQKTALKLN